MGVGCKLI